jgi:hypothetical protein
MKTRERPGCSADIRFRGMGMASVGSPANLRLALIRLALWLYPYECRISYSFHTRC